MWRLIRRTNEPDQLAIERMTTDHTASVVDMLPAIRPSHMPTGPYTHSSEHLWDEMRRIDLLIRAQVIRWRLLTGVHKPHDQWGMLHVTDAEMEAYLNSPFLAPDTLPETVQNHLNPYWEEAAQFAGTISERLRQTPVEIVMRLEYLQAIFDLSEFDKSVLLLAALPELDSRYRRLFGYLVDDASRMCPSVELVLQTLQPISGGRSRFDKSAPLLAHRLITLGDERPPSMCTVQVDERILGYILGSDRLDKRLHNIVAEALDLVIWDQLIADSDQITRLQAFSTWWNDHQADGAAVFLPGPYGSGRMAAAQAICADCDIPLLIASIENALNAPIGWQEVVDVAYREAQLRGAALYWSNCERLLETDQPAHRWQYVTAAAESFAALTFFASHTAWEPAGNFHTRRFLRFEFQMPTYAIRRRLWERYLPDPLAGQGALVDALANGFQLTQGQVIDALTTAQGLALRRDASQPQLTASDLYEGCRRQSGRQLITLARRVEPRTDLTFDDLILPDPNMRQINELRARIRHRSHVYSSLGLERRLSLGKGLIALFTGPSGTGKTMSAELLAREQGVDLYKVDLSVIVSKYVGETEKNLSRMFSEAEDANAIIFFDEADALFGKRGEVKEAQDRWANIEVNYLLQRVEEYTGVVILASNLRQNIDEAFLRRIHVIVEFPFPESKARSRIWQGMFPPAIHWPPPEEIDALAERFRLTGGNVKNIVIDATFRALDDADDVPIVTVRHLVIATAREYQKMGKPITPNEFGDIFYHWVEEDIF